MALFQKLYKTSECNLNIGSSLQDVARRLGQDRRGSIVIIMALVTPALVMSVGLAIEVSHWTVVKLELQRTADLAALAGATEYKLASNASNAANAAASFAELNGAVGGTTRTWDPGAKLLSDNQITAQVVAGIRNSENSALKVTVTQTVPLALTRIMSSLPHVSIGATGWAELDTGWQPCILALSAGGTGVTAQGNPTVEMTGCSIRSNALDSKKLSIHAGGSATMSASAFYANGSISDDVTGPQYENAGTIPDPYSAHSALQSALQNLSPDPNCKKKDCSTKLDSQTLSHGTWSGWDIKNTVSLNPGIYYVNGDISLNSGGLLTGTGVTIVMSGSLSMHGHSSMTLSAALAPANANDAIPGGAIPGIVFAGNSTATSVFRGNTSPSLTGVVYYPNGTLDFGGTAQAGSAGCLEIIAASIEMGGNSTMSSKCSNYGALRFSSGGPAIVALVQ